MTVYADLLRYRELFGNLFRRDFQARYKGSALGIALVAREPAAADGGLRARLLACSGASRSSIHDYPLYLLVGLAAWVFFSTSLTLAARSMLDNAPLIRKTRFPRQLVALSAVATQLVTFVVMLAVLLVLTSRSCPEARDTAWLAVPLAVAVRRARGRARARARVARTCSSATSSTSSAALLLPWFFLTPVLYPFDQIPGAAEHETLVDVLRWGNPVTPPIEALRAPLWEGALPVAGRHASTSSSSAVVSLALGAWVFSRVDDRIAVEL